MTLRPSSSIATGALLLLLGQVVATAQAPAPQQPAAAQQGSKTGTLRIYLARHGQTDGNLNGRAQGWTDTPLNATGREQAARLAQALKGLQLDAIYSSTLSRSRQTAETVASGRPVTSLPGLREMNLGKFEDVSIKDPELRNRRPGPENPDHGETGQQFFDRVSAAVKQIRDAHASGAVLIVGHAGANQQILRTLLGLTPEQVRTVSQSNDELYMIELDPGAQPRLFKYIPLDKLNEL